MVDPRLALLVFATAVAIVAVLFWPRHGLVVRLFRLVRMTERVRVEDALKHLHNREYHGKPPSIDSLAGALETSRARAVALVARLKSLGLVRADGLGLPLTETGRAYALRIIRSHRLWERYLADRTSVEPADWHEEAERREHTLTADAVEELDARMGHPRFDPHGDPIPTRRRATPADGRCPDRAAAWDTRLDLAPRG